MLAAIIPMQGDRRFVAASGELKFKMGGTADEPLGNGLKVDHRDAGRRIQIERPEGSIEGVAGPVTELATAEIPPATPRKRRVGRAVFTFLRGPEPEIPIEGGGWCQSGGGEGGRNAEIRPFHEIRAIKPSVDFAHFAEHARFIPFFNEANAFRGVALIAHLGDHLVVGGRAPQGPRLPDIVG